MPATRKNVASKAEEKAEDVRAATESKVEEAKDVVADKKDELKPEAESVIESAKEKIAEGVAAAKVRPFYFDRVSF